MTKLFELFPQGLKEQSSSGRRSAGNNPQKKKTSENKRGPANPPKSLDFAFSRPKKLPLDTQRQVLSALNHFYSVAGVSEEERSLAFKKIVEKADLHKICTMGFRNKYSQYL